MQKPMIEMSFGLLTPMDPSIDREFGFYEFFSFLKFNEFYYFFRLKKIRKKFGNFANHRCLTCFDVLECNVHFIRTTDHCKVQTAFVSKKLSG